MSKHLLMPLLLISLCVDAARAQGQQPAPNKAPRLFTNKTKLYLPVALNEPERSNLKAISLYVKKGQGTAWVRTETAPSDRKGFEYLAMVDGEYQFAICTLDKDGKSNPERTSDLPPALIVTVDTHPPDITLRDIHAAAGVRLIECTVKDANADAGKLLVEQMGPDKKWHPLALEKNNGSRYPVRGLDSEKRMVRAIATDLAGNTSIRILTLPAALAPAVIALPDSLPEAGPVTEKIVAVSHKEQPRTIIPASHSGPALPYPLVGPSVPVPILAPVPKPTPVQKLNPVPEPPGRAARAFVNSAHVSLEYLIDDLGPTGAAKVTVWITPDGGTNWKKLCEAMPRQTTVDFDLPGEGVYGVSLVVTNGSGISGVLPASGNAPDCWVEVDTTRPTAKILSLSPGKETDAGLLLIYWAAEDKNLGPTPIDLYYSLHPGGPWLPIHRGARNSGSYLWPVPANSGAEFFIRLDATDRAGNVTRCESPNPVVIDLARPKARVKGITAKPSSVVVPVKEN